MLRPAAPPPPDWYLRAALCYGFPLVPALLQLRRHRRVPFVRLHAVQAILFSCGLAAVQLGLFALAVRAGNMLTSERELVLAGLLAYAAIVVCGLVALGIWLHLLRAALAGRPGAVPLLTGCARLLARVPARRRPPRWPA